MPKNHRRRPPSTPIPPALPTQSPNMPPNNRTNSAAKPAAPAAAAAAAPSAATPTPRKSLSAASFASKSRTPRSTRRQLHRDMAPSGNATPTITLSPSPVSTPTRSSAARRNRQSRHADTNGDASARVNNASGNRRKAKDEAPDYDADDIDKLLTSVRDIMRSSKNKKETEPLMAALRRADAEFQQDVSDASSEDMDVAPQPAPSRSQKPSAAALRERLREANKKMAPAGDAPRSKVESKASKASTPQTERLKRLRSRLSEGKKVKAREAVESDASDMESTMRTHRHDIEALKKDDPEFYKFLEENDATLLEVDDLALDGDDDSEDGNDEEDGSATTSKGKNVGDVSRDVIERSSRKKTGTPGSSKKELLRASSSTPRKRVQSSPIVIDSSGDRGVVVVDDDSDSSYDGVFVVDNSSDEEAQVPKQESAKMGAISDDEESSVEEVEAKGNKADGMSSPDAGEDLAEADAGEDLAEAYAGEDLAESDLKADEKSSSPSKVKVGEGEQNKKDGEDTGKEQDSDDEDTGKEQDSDEEDEESDVEDIKSDGEEVIVSQDNRDNANVKEPTSKSNSDGAEVDSHVSDSEDDENAEDEVGTTGLHRKTKHMKEPNMGTKEDETDDVESNGDDGDSGAADDVSEPVVSGANASASDENTEMNGKRGDSVVNDDRTGYSSSDEDEEEDEMAEAAAAAEAGIEVDGQDEDAAPGDDDDEEMDNSDDDDDDDKNMAFDEDETKEKDEGDDGGKVEPTVYFVDLKYLRNLKEAINSKQAGVKVCKDLLRIFRAGRGLLPSSMAKQVDGKDQGNQGDVEEDIDPDEESGEKNDGFSTGNVKFASSKAYQQAMNLAIIGLQETLDRMLGKPSGKRVTAMTLSKWNPTESDRWATLEPIVSAFVTHMVSLSNAVVDPPTLRFLLKRLERVTAYTSGNERMGKSVVRIGVQVWSSSVHHISQETRLRAYLLLSQMAHVEGNAELVLRGCFNAYCSSIASACNPKTLGMIEFALACLVELFGIDMGASYTTLFSFLRQAAVALRVVLVSKEGKEEVERVHNWTFVNQLRMFGRVLGRYGTGDELGPLIYPYVQISLGLMRVHTTPRTVPLRLHVASYLSRLMRETGTYIPVAPHLLVMLRCSELRKRPGHGEVKAMDWRGVLRVPDEAVKTRTFLTGLVEGVTLEVARFFAAMAGHVSFPEVAWVCEAGLRKTAKEMAVPEWKGTLMGAAVTLRKTADLVVEARRKAGVAPRAAVGERGMRTVVDGLVTDGKKLPIERLFEVELERVEKAGRLRDEPSKGGGKEKRKRKGGETEAGEVEGGGDGGGKKRARMGLKGVKAGVNGKQNVKRAGRPMLAVPGGEGVQGEERDEVRALDLDSDGSDRE